MQNSISVQRCGGASPSGLVAVEFQEWFRLRALPAIIEFAREHFHQRSRDEWFHYKDYVKLCRAVGRNPADRFNPMFLVSLDWDSRHSMLHHWPNIDKGLPQRGPTVDRRDIPVGQPGYIPIDKYINYIPSAPRMADCLQFPIESVFADVKREFRRLVKQNEPTTAAELFALIQQAFAVAATQQTIQNCFRHAEENMRIFAGLEHETVSINGVKFQCTHGHWLPKCRRG